ncbi:transcription termination factor MTEF1, chloroplastic-like isoform X2 [Populus nigra]|uniref:transcription termination factor MTEF1, chloroplastic-like isoform X2 n=1 Tax=Populus nigra TaxID=3691 RepID=UPI002B277153|nr:transcription termination factor MTEF1, chloroplastic-like isoform X2 [Populus nigra]
MAVRAPWILTLSMDRNLGPKLDYFVREIKGDLEEFKKFPRFFSFSLERKIKPRHRMLVEYGLKMPLSRMLKVNEGEFNARLFEMLLRMVEERCKDENKGERFPCLVQILYIHPKVI